MTDRYPFSSVTHVALGEVRISEEALLQSNNSLRDLLPGQWALGQTGSVFRDTTSRRMLVDTYDQAVTQISSSEVRQHPAVAKVQVELGGKAVFGYVADVSNIRHLLYLTCDLGLENLNIDDHRLQRRARLAGTELLMGIVFKEYGELSYSGLKEAESQAADFSSDYNQFFQLAEQSEIPLSIPMLNESIRRPKDIEDEATIAATADTDPPETS